VPQNTTQAEAITTPAPLIERHPAVDAHHRALLCERNGDWRAAIEEHRKALELEPENVELYFHLSRALQQEGCFNEAIELLRKARALNPDGVRMLAALGDLFYNSGDLESAQTAYEKLIEARPQSAAAWANLGVIYQEKNEPERALAMQLKAIELAPGLFASHNNIGVLYGKQCKDDEAIASFRRAIELNPRFSIAHFNLAHALDARGETAEAERLYHRAVELDPGSAVLRHYLGELHLSHGEYELGWQEFEYRWKTRKMRCGRRNFLQPQWKGEPLNGESVLLYAEQGLGDAMQFMRFAPLVVERGGRVTLEVHPPLVRFAQTLSPEINVIPYGAKLPDFRWQCSLMSLPLAFQTRVDSVPNATPYLHPYADEVERWAARFDKKCCNVGIAWAGNPRNPHEHKRAVKLAELAPLSRVEGVKLFSLQMGPPVEQLLSMPEGMQVVDLQHEQKDYAETAAIAANLDLVIAIDTSVAHMAGAVGRPVWVLLHDQPDWRWMRDRADSPWYPTARLFRQSYAEGWPLVIDRVASALDEFARQTLAERA